MIEGSKKISYDCKYEEGWIPTGSVVTLKKTGEFALITGRNELMQNPDSFLNYYVEIEGRGPGIFATYDDDIEVEVPLTADK